MDQDETMPPLAESPSSFRNSATGRLLFVYADQEPWKADHDEAQRCFDCEEQLASGTALFRLLLEHEARTQALSLRVSSPAVGEILDEMPRCYASWLKVSEGNLREAESFVTRGYPVGGIEEFRAAVEEARAITHSFDLESQLRPIEEREAELQPENPNPIRYSD